MQVEMFYPTLLSCFSTPVYVEKPEPLQMSKPTIELESISESIDPISVVIIDSNSPHMSNDQQSITKKRKYTKRDKEYCDTNAGVIPSTTPTIKKHYKSVLVFDTETTGLPPKVTPENINLPEMPRIIQLSYVLFDTSSYTIKKMGNHYIKLEDGIVIPPFITEITGIQSETCETRGIDIKDALIEFYNTAMEADCIIGHNIPFDIRMIQLEVERHYLNLEPIVPQIISLFDSVFLRVKNIDIFCTMKECIHICNIIKIDKNGRSYKKFPKLSELYLHLFKTVPEHLHNALIDVIVCLRCFMKVYMNKDIHDVKYNRIISNAMQIA